MVIRQLAFASTSAPDHCGNMDYLHESHFQQTVCLADWWLVKANKDVEGKRLAVAGHTGCGKQAMRVFTSAPILKRHDVFTIETSDGICVIVDGFINKARTLENGFPSDVFNCFVFGFPPYWKEYYEMLEAQVSPSKDISRNGLLQNLSPQLGCEQPHVDSQAKYSGSQGKTEAKGRLKSKKSNSFITPLPKCIVSGLHEESYSKCADIVEDHTAPELPVNDLTNEINSLFNLSGGGGIKVQAAIDKHVDYSKKCDDGVTLSACHLNKKRRKAATDSLRKMDHDKKSRANFDWDVILSERILSSNEERVTTRLIHKLKMKEMNNKKSSEISDVENIRLISNSSVGSGEVELKLDFDREPGSRNSRNPEDKGIREIKTKSKKLKVKNKATELPSTPAALTKSRCTPASVDNKMDTVRTRKNSLSGKASASDMETTRKFSPVSKETPKSKSVMVKSVSPQSSSFNRSRSGRLLMPTLEFWRNQRAVYNVDGKITGIDEGC